MIFLRNASILGQHSYGVGGKGKGEVGGSKVKEESGTIQVIEFRVVMKSISSCVVISCYCYSWPVPYKT